MVKELKYSNTNTYLVKGTKGYLLIDTGWAGTFPAFCKCMGELGIPVQEIWGKAVLIERGSRKIYPDPKKGMRWARFWHKAGKVYRFCKRIKNGLARRIHKLKREVPGEDRI